MRRTATVAALLCGLSVLLGAFAAHGLKPRLGEYGGEIWQTGVRYQFLHALALLWLGTTAVRITGAAWIARLWLAGIVLFSGSLYALALGGGSWLGPLTPLGGLCFLGGWGLLALRLGRTEPV